MARTKWELEFDSFANFPVNWSETVLYIATDTNVQYRWNGSSYVSLWGGGGGGGTVDSVVAWTNISVDNTDPANPIVSSLADRYKTTSTTSQTIVSTWSLTFTVWANLAYTALQDVSIVFDVSNHMHGTVTSYSGTTLVVDISHKTGAGTYASWTINLDAIEATPVTVTDSSTINLSITSQDITADVVAGSIGTTQLSAGVNTSLWKADTSLQPSAIGTTVQAYDADLTTWAWKTAPSGTVVWDTDTQTLTNKTVNDSTFIIQDDVDNTKKLQFQASGIGTGTTVTLTSPNTSGTLAILSGVAQTFASTTTFSGATVTVWSSTATSTYGLGTGATASGNTKTVNIGTSGVSGSTTNVNIGSTVSGATGTTTINTPTLAFGSNVIAINLPDASTFIVDNADTTKKGKFEASSITTATTRTYTLPDKDGTVAMTSDIVSGGDVTWPASSVTGRIATFNGTTGKIIQDGGSLISDLVATTGNQTIAGTKTFSSDIIVPDEIYWVSWDGSLEVPTKNAIYDQVSPMVTNLASKADDTSVVHNTWNETILWLKNFSSNIQTTGIELWSATDTTIARIAAGRISVEWVELVRNGDTPQLTAINLWHASDTTIARVSAWVVSIEGVNICTVSSADTLTNKNLTSVTNTFPTFNQNTTGEAGTVATINGKISAGTNVTITGTGTTASPYVINSTWGGGWWITLWVVYWMNSAIF